MLNYSTVEEKAAEWNITPRHIQYLCRAGKIEGALKRAGSWFIPQDAIIPGKNTKSDIDVFAFTGTKNKIFSCAVELIMSKGFHGVSLRDIAQKVGIRQSTIYNHFSSKQEILDTIYDYYCHFYLKDRPRLKDLETILRNGSLEEIIRCVRYDFHEDYQQQMSDITKIIFQRISIDDRAREIAKMLMIEAGINYVEDVFSRAIEIGRLAAFDTHAMAVFINSISLFTLYYWIASPSPESMARLKEDEKELYKYATVFLTELNKD